MWEEADVPGGMSTPAPELLPLCNLGGWTDGGGGDGNLEEVSHSPWPPIEINPTQRCVDTSRLGLQSLLCAPPTTAYGDPGCHRTGSVCSVHSGRMGQGQTYPNKHASNHTTNSPYPTPQYHAYTRPPPPTTTGRACRCHKNSAKKT